MAIVGGLKLVDAQNITVVGCFQDDALDPKYISLPGQRVGNSPAGCIAQCARNGFTHAMVQKIACLCGNGTVGLSESEVIFEKE